MNDRPPETVPRLAVRGLSKTFGGLVVARGIDLTLERGARTALIGPNGAGKTTFVDLITGALRPSAGTVALDGADITRRSQAARVRAGLVRTFQVTRLFRELTVGDNVRLALVQRRGETFAMLRDLRAIAGLDEETAGILGLLGLTERARVRVDALAYGEQRLVEIALALALRPRVLLLDEPAAGVPQSESGVVLDAVASLPPDLAVLLIEHDMDLVFRFAREIAVLASGALLTQGTPAEIAADEAVRRIYFGGKAHGRRRH